MEDIQYIFFFFLFKYFALNIINKKDNGYSNEIYFLDLVYMRWAKPIIDGTAPLPRESFSMNLVRDDIIWVFGGYSMGGVKGDLFELNLNKMRWSEIINS